MNLKIETVQNGQEAVEVFASHPVDYFSLILMDCHMPVVCKEQ
jgi:CheY-like chemotaxis protein